MASSLNDAMNTRVTTAVAASRPLAASTTPTPVMTSWLRPRRRRSMAHASSWLVGLPSGWPSTTTIVSAPSTTPSVTRPATARAFLSASAATGAGVIGAASASSTFDGTTTKSRISRARSSRLRGEAEARMTTGRRGGLEVAERHGGDDDAEDADDVDLERHTQRESDQPEIERHGRRDADGRALREELLDPSAGEITEQLAEEGADDETGHDDQHDEAEPTLGRRAGGDVYATISGLASVTTRVSAAIARRRCLGRPKACWWVWPSQ